MTKLNRRDFIVAGAVGTASLGFWTSTTRSAEESFAASIDRPVVAYIGTGLRYHELSEAALPLCTCAALCDVDQRQLHEGKEFHAGLQSEYRNTPHSVDLYEEYERVLDRQDIDAVIVATPDHWHTKVAIDAMRSGKDVYCEKPLTLTIAEGTQIKKVQRETGRVLQVGTQQRSTESFQTAVALMRHGRIGTPKRLTCAIGGSPVSPSLPQRSVPDGMNWDRWLGQAPAVAYRQAHSLPGIDEYGSEFPFGRAHAHFRWWYEYAGGKLTDWGAHHVDIAMWALNKSDSTIGPFTIDPLVVEHPVAMRDGFPVDDDRFNTATKFHLRVTFADGVQMDIRDEAKEEMGFENGIMFQGNSGRYLVNRERFAGKPVELLKEDPLPDGSLDEIYPHRVSIDDDEGTQKNMLNFFECIKNRNQPISDVATHHRHLSVCHAANIALRLGRKLTFDPQTESFVGDSEANAMIGREQRKGYEITA